MRLSNRGTVDRSTLIRFTFDGRPILAFAGDTVASALLAEGTRMLARSFKYHRPRGVVTAGPDDPSALVTIGKGAERTPNVRATQQEVYAGLEVFSQNAWPSLDWDLLSLNDRFSRFLGAGFYYKTFMWPAKFWEGLYEPLIRRAAGLGALSGAPATEVQDKSYAFCDLLIIGGGPAGLFAALIAGRSGADVLLMDEDSALGGRLNSEAETIDGAPAQDWLAATIAELRALPNVRLMPRTTVTGAYDGGTYGALERVNRHRNALPSAPMDCFWRIHTKQALLCTGARERMIAFPGNDRPGVMSAAAVRTYLHRYGALAGPRVAVFGNNDDAHRTARDLSAAGVQVTALIDTRPDAAPDLGELRAPFPVFTGAEVFDTEGRHGLHTIRVRHGDMVDAIEADCLAVSGGWNPEIGLATHFGAKPIWDAGLAAYLPPAPLSPNAVPGLRAAGAAAGALSTHAALASAQAAVTEALATLGLTAATAALPDCDATPPRVSAFWQVEAPGRAFLDLQNDVTTKDIALAAREGFTHAEHMKRYTTQGMATDQGKVSNLPALGVLAALTGRDLPATGTTSWRPPQVPVPINAMGAGGLGHGFAPQRYLTSHQAALERGAPMLEAGLWYRAAYFPKPGETTWRQSTDREVQMVRRSVGVCDVSTLGKFELQGPDAGALLDLVYTSRMSTLAEGKTRYGVMLREDGFILDDGTCARLGPEQYLLTSTTAAAAEVAAHLEFVRQVYLPKARVRITDVTEQWVQTALTGPRATELLDLMLDAPLPVSDLPFMGCLTDRIGGVPVRLFRISFSGERGYEVALPARYGASFWRLLVAQAESLGGGAYGLEALNVLRIEKGLLTHAEIDGRVTLDDLGLGKMMSDKDCIGRAQSLRPGLTDAGRLQLVGLKPLTAHADLTSGALLLPLDAAETAPDVGHIKSSCYSPTLGRTHALALLKDGRARLGSTVRVIDHLRGIRTLAEICSPCAYDPTGAKMR